MTEATERSAGLPAGNSGTLLGVVTLPAAKASALARNIVEEGGAAWVDRLPGARSTDAWNGCVEQADEALLLLKTTVAGYPALARRVRELHPYGVPEILARPVVAGFGPSLEWLKRSVTPA